MQKLFNAINLGDRYEINARLLPAMLVVLPVTTLALGLDLQSGHALRGIGIGTGLETILAVVFSKLGQALGRRLEDRYCAKWGGLPTTRWLLPRDTSHSEQQKRIWRRAIEVLSGLSFESLLDESRIAELRKAIGDGVLTVRNKIRADKRAELLRQHNIYYGFARNLSGLGWCAATISTLSVMASAIAIERGTVPIAVGLIEALFAIAAVGFLMLREKYVGHSADRYAEFFLTTATTIANAKTVRTGTKTADKGRSL